MAILWLGLRWPPRVANASYRHNELRDALNGGRYGARIRGSYLTGSYARHTAVSPIDDVDIVFEIEPTAWGASVFSLTPSPSSVIDSFARAIRYRYTNCRLRTQRRSVGLLLDSLDIDVVSAINDGGDYILVPDCRTGGWIRSSPKTHAVVTTQANQVSGGLAVPAIKLLKHWNNNLPRSTQTKSFFVESIAVHLFGRRVPTSLSEAALFFWDFMAQLGGEPAAFDWNGWNIPVRREWPFGRLILPDTAGLSDNMAPDFPLQLFGAKARLARDRVFSARNARSEQKAYEYLGQIVTP